jgi:N-methylhydantoinase B
MDLDGFDFPVTLKAAMIVAADRITVDYAGSSKASRYGINSPKCYTDAYTIFGLKCVIAPKIPNNAGSLAPFRVEAEPGSIVHPQDPSPVTARHVIGQMLPDVALGCLAAAVPGIAPAESAGSMWVLAMASAHGRVDPGALEGASRFNLMNVAIGGIGARPGKDGISATAFPSGVGVIPIEVTESQSPLVFWRKELACDSGGAGAVRGGLGQVLEIGSREPASFTISAATFDRTRHPARGRDGGRPGAVGAARLSNGEELVGKGVHVVPAGERLIIETPGGGGLGDPRGRAPEALHRDLEAGLVSRAAAASEYGLDVS